MDIDNMSFDLDENELKVLTCSLRSDGDTECVVCEG